MKRDLLLYKYFDGASKLQSVVRGHLTRMHEHRLIAKSKRGAFSLGCEPGIPFDNEGCLADSESLADATDIYKQTIAG